MKQRPSPVPMAMSVSGSCDKTARASRNSLAASSPRWRSQAHGLPTPSRRKTPTTARSGASTRMAPECSSSPSSAILTIRMRTRRIFPRMRRWWPASAARSPTRVWQDSPNLSSRLAIATSRSFPRLAARAGRSRPVIPSRPRRSWTRPLTVLRPTTPPGRRMASGSSSTRDLNPESRPGWWILVARTSNNSIPRGAVP